VQALLRIAVVWNIPVACNRASADFLIASPLLSSTYERFSPDYHTYLARMDEDQEEEQQGATQAAYSV